MRNSTRTRPIQSLTNLPHLNKITPTIRYSKELFAKRRRLNCISRTTTIRRWREEKLFSDSPGGCIQ